LGTTSSAGVSSTIAELPRRQMLIGRGASRAVTFGSQEHTFASLDLAARRLASGLIGLGLSRGDHVAVAMRNGMPWIETFFAFANVGIVCVPINVFMTAGELSSICEDAETKAIIIDDASIQLAIEASSTPPIVILASHSEGIAAQHGFIAYEDLLRAAPLPISEVRTRPVDTAVLHYSSGTTGKPKAAIHSHGAIMWNAISQVVDLGLTAADHNLVIASFSWAAGFHSPFIGVMTVGGSSHVMPTGGVTIESIAQAIHGERCTRSFMVPTLLKQLILDPQSLGLFRSSPIRSLITGGEAVPPSLLHQFAAELPDLAMAQGYGLSEFPTLATLLRADEAHERIGSAGRPTTITNIAVVTQSGEISMHGSGEILVRSPATTLGYHGQPELTASALADGWLHTGDLGEIDADGYLTVTGRVKDMIISGGLNVYPAESESVILTIEGVKEVAVVGVADDRWGEVPIAIINSDQPIDEEAFIAKCLEKLPSYKTPKRVLRYDGDLPKNANGKLLKRELRPWATESLAQEPNNDV
jgi:fatty-acyl-CoA synthase